MATLGFNATRIRTPSLPRIPRSSSFTKPIKTSLFSSESLSKRCRFVSRSLPESSLSITKEEAIIKQEEESQVEEDDPTSELSYLDPETDSEGIKEWELDFCSRPILDSRGKKIWELVVCDASLSLQVTKYFPNNVINSITLKDAIVSITQDLGVPLPEKIRFFRWI
ncbi:unnamed protein product [Thlaspi arvense]|uniref:RNA-binding protein Tab2-like N-terminal domain-containing protein n=1 Tax=Thlaspi arvense TaxID=13288 RepID=A0AAU9S0J7_THLAR|nr:unnamed protein product [Thlaspi arvense]